MQPGYPGSGQDPYGQQPPYVDPYSQPQYSPQQPQPPQQPESQQQPQDEQPSPPPQYPQPPQYPDPYAQPTSGGSYPDPYAQPTSGGSYPPPGYPGGAPYPTAGYGAPMGMPPQQNNTLGLVGMILGIASIPLSCCAVIYLPLSFLTGIAGIVLGILGIRKASAGEASNRGQALTGVICGAVSLLLTIVGLIIATAIVHHANLPTTT